MFRLFLISLLVSFSCAATDFQYFEDPEASLNLEQIKALKDDQWVTQKSPNFGYSTSHIWIRFNLNKIEKLPGHLMFSLSDPIMDHVTLYSPDGTFENIGESGDKRLRSFPYRYPVAQLPSLERDQFYYVELASFDPIQPTVKVRAKGDFYQSLIVENSLHAIYFGIMLVMILYNFLIFLITRNSNYWHYVMFIGTTFYVNFALNGFTLDWLFQDNYLQNSRFSIISFLGLTAIAGCVFCKDFLGINNKHPVINFVINAYILLAFTLLFVTAFHKDDVFVHGYSLLVVSLFPLVIISSAIYGLVKRLNQALYFFIAWLFFIIALTVRLFVASGALENNLVTFYAAQVGSLLEVVLLSIALAARIKNLQSEKRELIKNTNDQLRELNQKLVKSNQLKDEFLTNISHELRTPINGIKGMITILKQRSNKDDQHDLALRSANHIQTIIEKLLILTEANDHHLQFENHWFSLESVIKNIEKNYASEAIEQKCPLKFNMTEVAPIQYFGQLEPIEFILSEYIENAIKFGNGNPVTINIKRSLDNEQNCQTIFIEVIDKGIGIENKTNLFTPFWQQESHNRRKYGGLGIGLSVVKLLGDAINAQINIDNNEQLGTTASIALTLPYREKVSLEDTKNLENIRVLIVEDNMVNLVVLQTMIKKMGCQCFTAENGKIALDVLQQQTVDIILMDCQMPVMDGFEATKAIRHSEEAYFNTPIIAVTANTTTNDRLRCFDVGMDAFLKKPVDFKQVEQAIGNYTTQAIKTPNTH